MGFLGPKRRTVKVKKRSLDNPSRIILDLSCGHSQEEYWPANRPISEFAKTTRCEKCEDPHTYYRTSY